MMLSIYRVNCTAPVNISFANRSSYAILFCLSDFFSNNNCLFVCLDTESSFSIASSLMKVLFIYNRVSWNWGCIVVLVVVHAIAMLVTIMDDTVFSAFVMITIFQRLLYSHFLLTVFSLCNTTTATLRRMSIIANNSSVLIGSYNIILQCGWRLRQSCSTYYTDCTRPTHHHPHLSQPIILCHPPTLESRLGVYNVDC